MPVLKFDSFAEVDNVIAQLPPAAVGPDSGFISNPQEDGSYELVIPAKWAAAVKRADPQKKEPPARRAIPKSIIMARLTAAKKIDVAFQTLMQRPELFARWFAADRPTVYSDDADTVEFLKGIGVNVDEILAPE